MERSGFRARWRRHAIDLTPLRDSRDFRLLWLGELVSEAGSQVALVAVFVQVFALTHSSAAVGLVGLVQLMPLALAALLGGPIIDAVDRRRLLLWAQCGQAGASGLLLTGAVIGHPPLAFLRNYLLKGGITDGVPGLIISVMNAYYVFLKFAKLWELSVLPSHRHR